MKRVFGRGILLGFLMFTCIISLAQVSRKAQKQYNKALAVLNQDWNKSLVYIHKALAASPKFPAAYVTRGKIFHGQGKDSLAYEAFNQALAIDSGFVPAWEGTAEVLSADRAWSAVIVAYTRALHWGPTNSELYFQRAQAHARLKNYLDAILDFSEAIDLDSTKYKYYLRRGITNRKMEYTYAALADFDQAIRLVPSLPAPRKERIRALVALNDKEAAISDLEELAVMQPKDAGIHYFRGKIYYSLEETAAANRAFSQAIEADHENMEAYLGRAIGRVETGDRPGAIQDLDQVLRLAPNNASIFLYRGKLQMEGKAIDKALPDFSKAVELDSTLAEAYYLRGFAQSSLGDKVAATLDFEKVIAIRPDAIDAYYNLGILYAIQSRYTDALIAHRKVEELKPGYKDNRDLYARLQERLRRQR
ncbi:MAG TPA: tetratricopeptide repeat protein [Bacteroidetes bacterium]|nr:tetratricopeptide repeat protein [Bacteroidota bacterium]